MRMMRLFVIGLLLCGTANSTWAHKYYFSTSELSFNNNTQQLEWILEFTTHDLEYALSYLNDTTFNIETESGQLALKRYLLSHLRLKIKERTLSLNWVGLEFDHHKVQVFIEAKVDRDITILEVEQTALIDVFKHQVNLVNYSVRKTNRPLKTGTMKFDNDNKVGKISLL